MKRFIHTGIAACALAVCLSVCAPVAWAALEVDQAPRHVQNAPGSAGVVDGGIDARVYEGDGAKVGADSGATANTGGRAQGSDDHVQDSDGHAQDSAARVQNTDVRAQGSDGCMQNNAARAQNIERSVEDQAGRARLTNAPLTTQTTLPSRFDAREQGWVTDIVRNQDPWGTCWAISALEAMETNLLKQGKTLKDSFSVRQLVWSAGTPLTSSSKVSAAQSGIQPKQLQAQIGEGQIASPDLQDVYDTNAVFEMGGNYFVVYQAVASGRGPVWEASAPYKNDEGIQAGNSYAASGTWTLGEAMRFGNVAQLRHAHVLPVPANYDAGSKPEDFTFNEEALAAVKRAIQEYGSVAIAYDSASQYYNDAYNTWFSDDSRGNGHGVQIVGWDDSIPREWFTTGTYGLPEGDGAWIVRNSWGAADQDFPNENDWGDGGYFYLSYYDRSAQMYVAYDMMLSTDADATDVINQHDYLGQMSQASARLQSVGTELVSANVFTVEQDQNLKAVSADTYAPGTRVTVQVYLLSADAANPSKGTNDPTKGTLLEEKTVTFDFGGYHRIQLDKTHRILKGQRFAVVERIIEPDGTFIANMEAGNSYEAMQQWGYYHHDTVVVNPGESYVFAALTDDEDPTWRDAVDVAAFLTEQSSVNTPYGNILIKAFSDATGPLDPENPEQPEKSDPEKSDDSKQSQNDSNKQKQTTKNKSETKVTPRIQAGQATPKPVQARATAATGDAIDLRVVFLDVRLFACFVGCVGILFGLIAFVVRARTQVF